MAQPVRIATIAVMGLLLAGCQTAVGEPAQERNAPHAVRSPDGSLRFAAAAVGNHVTFTVTRGDATILAGTLLDFAFATDAPLGLLDLTDGPRTVRNETYTMPTGKRSHVRDHCRELTLVARERDGERRSIELLLRAYDDGVAFRYRVPAQAGMNDLRLSGEGSRFTLPDTADVWALPTPDFVAHYEHDYVSAKMADLPQATYGLPMLAHLGDAKAWVAITESDLLDHPATYLRRASDSSAFDAILSPPFPAPGAAPTTKASAPLVATLPHTSPWRVILVGDSPGRLVESDLVQTLAEPSRVADTSWIHPGKISFLWWNGYVVGPDAGFTGDLDTRTLKYYIDFAAENGIPYVSVDGFREAWYGGPNHPWLGADITHARPALDLPAVLAYARSKNVRLRLWVNSGALRAQMERAIPLYAQWGVEGIMADFVERDDQDDVNFQTRLLELCAEHHLTVTFHNCPKPTGLTRTYPNLLSVEAVRNAEYNKFAGPGSHPSTPEHELIVPFVRMLAGPVDYHSGGFRAVRPGAFVPREIGPLVIGTRSRELARYIVYENPMPMVADDPGTYRANLDTFAFLRDVPTTWDDTRVLSGEVGEEIVVARRKGDDWYLGAMANDVPRELHVPLTFLGPGQYTARGWRDGPNDADPNLALPVEQPVDATTTLDIPMGPAGGYAVRITRR